MHDLKNAMKKAGVESWPLPDVHFWHFDLDIKRKDIDKACAAITNAFMVGSINGLDKKASVVVLMYILRNELPHIRQNRLWPDVSQYFNNRSNGGLTTEQCAENFRLYMRHIFGRQLASIDHQKKYVVFLLEETGVGYDRSRIILEFMSSVLKSADLYFDRENDAADFAKKYLRQHVGISESRTDMDVLSPVLIKTATALLQLRSAIVDYADPWKVKLWGWNELREFWYKKSGKRLESLIPEAQEIFSALIVDLGKTISCELLFRFIKEGTYTVVLPGTDKAPCSSSDIPLCKTELIRSDSSMEIFTVDVSGKTCEQVMLSKERKWHQVNDHVFYIWQASSEKFHVIIDGINRQESRPVMHPMSGQLSGYVWSGYLRSSQKAIVEESNIVLKRDLIVEPRVIWKFSSVGVSLEIPTIGLFNHHGFNDAVVIFNTRVIWKGTISNSQSIIHIDNKNQVAELDFSDAFANMEFSIVSKKSVIWSTVFTLPLYFAVWNSRLVKSGELIKSDGNGLSGLILVGARSTKQPDCKSGTLSKFTDWNLPSTMQAYRVTCDTLEACPSIVKWNGNTWKEKSKSKCLEYAGPRAHDLPYARIQTTGNIFPVKEKLNGKESFLYVDEANKDRLNVQIEYAGRVYSYQAPHAGNLYIDEILASQEISDVKIIGLIRVQLVLEGKPTGAPVFLYVIGDRADVINGNIFKPPFIRIKNENGGELSIIADKYSKCTLSPASAVIIFIDEDDLDSDAGVTFSWLSTYQDISLRLEHDVDELIGTTNVNTFMRASTKVDGEWGNICINYITSPSNHIGVLNMEQDDFSINLLWKEFSRICDPNDSTIAWNILDSDVIYKNYSLSLESEVLEIDRIYDSNSNTVVIKPCWVGLLGRNNRIEVWVGEELIGQKSLANESFNDDVNAFTSSYNLLIPDRFSRFVSSGDISVDIKFFDNIHNIYQLSFTLNVKKDYGEDADNLKKRIKKLCNTDIDDKNALEAAKEILFLNENYYIKYREFPFDSTQLLAQLERISEMSNISTGGIISLYSTRKSLFESDNVPSIRPKLMREATLTGILSSTLHAVILYREFNKGTMNPENNAELKAVLLGQMKNVNDKRQKSWLMFLELILAYCSNEALSLHKNVCKAAKNPLYSVDDSMLDTVILKCKKRQE